MGVEAVVDDLLAAQLIDQVRFAGQPAYVFHHPSIRTVAYELQLESDRAELHRRARPPSKHVTRQQAMKMPP